MNAPAQQLLVDVSVIIREDAGTGIQRVVRALWDELNRIAPQHISMRPVFATRDHSYRYAPLNFLERCNLDPDHQDAQIRVKQADMFLGLDLAAHLLPRHEQQIATWKAHGATVHMVLYDMLPYQRPGWFRWRSRRNFRRWLGFIERQADQIICISSAVANDVDRWRKRFSLFSRRPIFLATIRLGSDIANSKPSMGLPENFNDLIGWMAERPCVLAVGTIEPRKAYDRILAAFEQLWMVPAATPPRLLIVGRPGWKTRALQARLRRHTDLAENLRWVDNASDEMLQRLYAASTGLLFASHAEGLGLPLLEAAAYAKPVLARNLPVYQELDLPNATFFTDDGASALSHSLQNWLSELKPTPARHNLPTWSDSARDLVSALAIAVG